MLGLTSSLWPATASLIVSSRATSFCCFILICIEGLKVFQLLAEAVLGLVSLAVVMEAITTNLSMLMLLLIIN